MALQTATISSRILNPKLAAGYKIEVAIEATSVGGILKETATGDVIGGVHRATTQSDGTLEVVGLPKLPQTGVEPADARWRATFKLVDPPWDKKISPPATVEFELTANTTWGALVDVSGVPITESLVNLVNAARDETLAARDQAQAAAESVQREQAGGVAGLTADGKLFESRLPNRLSPGDLSATIATKAAPRALGISAAQAFMAALARGASDLVLLNIGDSTTNDYADAFGRFVDNTRTQYPTHTFTYRNLDYDTSAYTAPTTLQTGTGTRTVSVYNAAVSGMDADYHLGLIGTVVAAVQPDLVIIGHGHNMTAIADNFRAKYQELVTSVMQLAPRAGVICTSQNPIVSTNSFGKAADESEVKANVIAQVARELGAGFIDVLQAFKDFGPWETALMSTDGLHPTFADNGSGYIGYQVWADYLSAHFVRDHNAGLLPKPASPLAVVGANLLDNADFSEIDILAMKHANAPSTISGWTPTNCTLTREGTITETSVGSSVKLATAATGAGGWMEQSLPLLDVRGHYVTLTVRMYVPAGADVTAGRIAISDTLGQTTSPNQVVAKGRDCWRTFTVSRYIAANASSPKVTIYSESGTGGASSVYVSWASLSRGSAVPRRPAPRRAASDTLWLPVSAFDAVGAPVKGSVGTRTPAWKFPDASVDNWIVTSFQPPRGWGQYEVQIVGANAGAGAGNVVFDLEQRTSTNSSDLTAAPSATKQIVSSALAQNIQQVLSTRVTSVTGTGTFQMTRFTMQELFIRRNGTHASDTLANDYAVIGVRLLRIT